MEVDASLSKILIVSLRGEHVFAQPALVPKPRISAKVFEQGLNTLNFHNKILKQYGKCFVWNYSAPENIFFHAFHADNVELPKLTQDKEYVLSSEQNHIILHLIFHQKIFRNVFVLSALTFFFSDHGGDHWRETIGHVFWFFNSRSVAVVWRARLRAEFHSVLMTDDVSINLKWAYKI